MRQHGHFRLRMQRFIVKKMAFLLPSLYTGGGVTSKHESIVRMRFTFVAGENQMPQLIT